MRKRAGFSLKILDICDGHGFCIVSCCNCLSLVGSKIVNEYAIEMPRYFNQGRTVAPLAREVPGWQARKRLCACPLAYTTLERVEAPPKGGVSGPAPPRHVHGVLTTPPSGTAGVRRIRGGTDARSMRLCARALRPLAHPAARSHAQGMRAASTAGTRRSPRAVA